MYFLIEHNPSYNLESCVHIGHTWGYDIYFVDETIERFIDFSGVSIVNLEKDVAFSWKFVGRHQESISVKPCTPAYEQIYQKTGSYEDPKEKYFLTEEDKKNSLVLFKIIMIEMLKKHYRYLMKKNNLFFEKFEENTNLSLTNELKNKFFIKKQEIDSLQNVKKCLIYAHTNFDIKIHDEILEESNIDKTPVLNL